MQACLQTWRCTFYVRKACKSASPACLFFREITVDGQKTAHAGEIKLAFDFYPVIDGASESKAVEGAPVSS